MSETYWVPAIYIGKQIRGAEVEIPIMLEPETSRIVMGQYIINRAGALQLVVALTRLVQDIDDEEDTVDSNTEFGG